MDNKDPLLALIEATQSAVKEMLPSRTRTMARIEYCGAELDLILKDVQSAGYPARRERELSVIEAARTDHGLCKWKGCDTCAALRALDGEDR